MSTDDALNKMVGAIGEVAGALASKDMQVAEAKAQLLVTERAPTEKRETPNRKLQADIYKRDRFTCRYCDIKTVPFFVMRAVSSAFPEEFPYHLHGKTDLSHPAYQTVATSCDHLVPGTKGGGWLDPDNLVTACWKCNLLKGNFTLEELGWDLRPIYGGLSWDGLTDMYVDIWKAAGCPNERFHTQWFKALGVVWAT